MRDMKQRLIDLLETHQGDPMVAGEWSEQIIGWLLPEIRHIQAEVWDECEEALHNFIVDPFGDRPSNPYDRPASVPEDRDPSAGAGA